MKELLMKTLNERKNYYIDQLLRLVQADTRLLGHGLDGGLEKNGQIFLEALFRSMNASKIVKDPIDERLISLSLNTYGEGNPGHNLDDRYNLYAHFNGSQKKSIMFNGHIDTLPAAEPENWSFSPLQAHVRNNKIYGIGVCDMKAGLMAPIMAIKLLQDAGIELPVEVIVSAVCDEEGGGNGSIVAAMNGLKADAVVVCEPTNSELIIAHMGWVFFKVEVEGVSVHSGLKLVGTNAIEKTYIILNALRDMEHNWLLKYKHELLPPPSGNVGVIYGGDAGSTIPDYCCFKTCVLYLPEMTQEQVVSEYTNTIMRCCQGDEWLKDHLPKISIYQTGHPYEMDKDHPIVNCFKEAYRDSTDSNVKIVGSPAGCDSRTWRNIAKCPTIQFGPGALDQSHTVDEYVTVDQYLEAILVYANLILKWGDSQDF